LRHKWQDKIAEIKSYSCGDMLLSYMFRCVLGVTHTQYIINIPAHPKQTCM